MRKFYTVAFALLLAFSVGACTGTLDELKDAVPLPKVTEETKAVFAAAISDVTLQVVTEAVSVARDITSAINAPSTAFSPLADAAQTITVNKTVTPDGGGKIVITGTVTGTGTQSKGFVTVDLKAVWTDLPVKGSTEKTSGSQTLKGTMGWDSAAGEDKDFTLDVDVVGSFERNGETYAFDVVVTMNGGNFAFTGSVNGQNVQGNQTVVSPTRTSESAPVAACLFEEQVEVCADSREGEPTCNLLTIEHCLAFTDTRWTSSKIDAQCAGAVSHPTTCPVKNVNGRCKLVKDGLPFLHYVYYWDNMNDEICKDEGGVWEEYDGGVWKEYDRGTSSPGGSDLDEPNGGS